jgi:hypothetical protein
MALSLLRREPAPAPEPRSWDEVAALVASLSRLADTWLGKSHQFHMVVDEDGCRMTLKRKGNEYHGKGRTPWEAAENMASGAAEIAEAVKALAATTTEREGS